MSDATDFTSAFNTLKRLAQPDVSPVLTYGDGTTIDSTKDLDAILTANKTAQTFAASASLSYGTVIQPTTRNGHRYRVIIGGTSGTEPTWPTGSKNQVTTGTVTLEEYGLEMSNIYDVTQAAFDAWQLKASKASQLLNIGDMNSIFENCIKQRDTFKRPLVA